MDKKINKYRGPDHWYNPKFFDGLHGKSVRYLAPFLDERKSVLDVGAGDGKLTWLLSQLTDRVVGLESQHMPIKCAKLMFSIREIQDIPFIQADALSLPFKEASFDLVTLFDVIEHISPGDLPELFREMKRVLRRYGKLAITTPNRGSLRNRIWGHRLNPKHYHEYDVTGLVQLLDAQDFRVEQLKGIYLPIPIPRVEHYGSIFPFRRLFSFLIDLGEHHPRQSETIFLIAGRA